MSRCRFCRAALSRTFIDLGAQPLANSYRDPADRRPERRYPLHAKVCGSCFLVQVDHDVPAEDIFSDYAYFSSVSTSWVAHARRYAEDMVARFGLSNTSLAVEIASNDGYLLQHFRALGVPVLGVEPAANVAAVAEQRGVPTRVAFFNVATATALRDAGMTADLIAANNVLAHVPEVNDFVGGFPILLKPGGVATFEFPHLLNLIEQMQFDTIYHEHYSYLSLGVVERFLARHGMRVFDVAELPTHGGSLRVFVCHAGADHAEGPALARVRAKEKAAGLDRLEAYDGFAAKADAIRAGLVDFLEDCKRRGRTVAAYGAAAKGNTLLNYCAIDTRLIAAVFDKSPHKQGRLLPGSGLPILPPERIAEMRPDVLLILPWNLAAEIMAEQAQIRSWSGRFATAIPSLTVT